MPVRKKSHSRKKRFKTQKAQNVRKRTRSKYIKKLRRKSILIGGLSIKEKIMAAGEKIMAARNILDNVSKLIKVVIIFIVFL